MHARERTSTRITIRPDLPADRDAIYAMRHDVYAVELGQHPINPQRRLSDALDAHNRYLIAESDGRMIGFISLTPPTAPSYSIEKYLKREQIPARFDDGLWEVRILTVAREHRRGPAALMLMRAGLHAIRDSGGRNVIVMGRSEVAPLYARVGLKHTGIAFTSGACEYQVMVAGVDDIERASIGLPDVLARIESALARRVAAAAHASTEPPALAPTEKKAPCDHGGAFFAAIGSSFDNISRRHSIISADVLDAWFPPAPGVMDALHEHLPWILSTSPPTHADGLIRALSASRNIPESSIAVGNGSSSLIFLAMRHWLTPASRILILDPMYAEYEHIFERVIGCRVDRLALTAANNFSVPRDHLRAALASGDYNLIAVVNPNNPTGIHIPRTEMESLAAAAHPRTRLWIDEAYIEYVGSTESMERFAAASTNTVVCKSLSKGYALSGARAAYLTGPAPIAAELRRITPPWSVSLPAQVAAIRALADPAYYAARYAQTHELRRQLAAQLRTLAPWRIHEGQINCILCLLPEIGPLSSATPIIERCREAGVFIRHCATISPSLGDRAIRISVKDAPSNARILDALCAALAATT